ncbi:MAG: Asp23/Gls24 family envelope stress response protein [bacterium]
MGKDVAPDEAPVLEQELGTLEVSEEVFHDLFAEAVAHVRGVASVSRGAGGLFGRSGDSVRVERGAAEVAFSVTVSVHYDVNIPDVAGQLRDEASRVVEALTGYKVRAVNVTIDHILPPQPPTAEEQEQPTGESIPDIPPVPDEE